MSHVRKSHKNKESTPPKGKKTKTPSNRDELPYRKPAKGKRKDLSPEPGTKF